jgi:hypothetical protein
VEGTDKKLKLLSLLQLGKCRENGTKGTQKAFGVKTDKILTYGDGILKPPETQNILF